MESSVLVVSCTASVHDRPKELTSEVRFAKILGRMATLIETVGVDPDIKEQGYSVRTWDPMTLHRVYVCTHICNCVGWFFTFAYCLRVSVGILRWFWCPARPDEECVSPHILHVCGFRKMWILHTKPRSLALSCFSVLQAIKSWAGPGKMANTWTFSIQSPTDSLHPTVKDSHDDPPSPCVCPVLGAVVPSSSASDQQCHSGGTHEDAEQEPHNIVTIWGQITNVTLGWVALDFT